MFYTTKQPAEVFPITVDFKCTDPGESIVAMTVTVKNALTGADTTGDILAGAAQAASGTQVRQRVHAGVHGETHIVQYRINTSLGNFYEAEVQLAVIEE